MARTFNDSKSLRKTAKFSAGNSKEIDALWKSGCDS